jgi:hypothetical protein
LFFCIFGVAYLYINVHILVFIILVTLVNFCSLYRNLWVITFIFFTFNWRKPIFFRSFFITYFVFVRCFSCPWSSLYWIYNRVCCAVWLHFTVISLWCLVRGNNVELQFYSWKQEQFRRFEIKRVRRWEGNHTETTRLNSSYVPEGQAQVGNACTYKRL